MTSRRIAATMGERKTEAWALALGVRVPLAHPYEATVRAHRGMLADVVTEPIPKRRSRLVLPGFGALVARLFGRTAVTGSAGVEAVTLLQRPSPRPAADPGDAETKKPGLAA